GIPGAPQRTERAAVQGRRGTAGESLEVRRRAVALVAGEREARIARIERAPHREQRRLENVEAIDLVAIRPADAEGERARADEEREPLALLRRQQLRVREPPDAPP